jgi:hypothetical protein
MVFFFVMWVELISCDQIRILERPRNGSVPQKMDSCIVQIMFMGAHGLDQIGAIV